MSGRLRYARTAAQLELGCTAGAAEPARRGLGPYVRLVVARSLGGVTDARRTLVVLFALGAIVLGTLGLAGYGDPLREMAGGIMCAGISVVFAFIW